MVSAIVLAAGASLRMGSPKALLKLSGKTFLQHIVDVLASAGVHDVVIVLGANANVIKTQLHWFRGTVVTNNDWNSGMLSSVIAGLGALGGCAVVESALGRGTSILVEMPLVESLGQGMVGLKPRE